MSKKNPGEAIVKLSIYDIGALRGLLVTTITNVEKQRDAMYSAEPVPDFYPEYLGQLNRCLEAVNREWL